MKIYINGSYFSEADAKISVFDHGLLYGDGIFEGIRIYNNRVFKLVEHVERLYYSAKAIALTIPMTQEEMIRAVVETCKANNLSDGYIRLVVTRGEGTLGLGPERCKKAQVIVIASTIQLYPDMFTVPMGPDRLDVLRDYVAGGRGFCMGGGVALNCA